MANTRRRSEERDGFPRRIDVTRFKEIGRINRPSGAQSWEDYDKRVAVLDELYEDNNLELLKAFARGEVSMDHLMRLKGKHQLDKGIADLRLQRSLFDSFEEVVPQLGSKTKTRDDYASLLARLVELSEPKLTEAAVVRDLKDLDWDSTMDAWEAAGLSGQSWKNMRVALGSFLSRLLGKKSSARQDIMDNVPNAVGSPERTPDASIEQLAAVVRRMPRRSGSVALSLLVTGVRVEEFLGMDPDRDLMPNEQAIKVAGRERRGKARAFTQRGKNKPSMGTRYVAEGFWPVVEWAARNRPCYTTVRRHWCQACHEVGLGVVTRTKNDPNHRWPQTFRYVGMRLHDLRHCYAQYVSDAGMPLSQLRFALGQSNESSAARYAARLAKKQAASIAGAAFGGAFTAEELWPKADHSDYEESEVTGLE
jgi:integrase